MVDTGALTVGRIDEIRRRMSDDGTLFRVSEEGLARHLARHLGWEDAFQISARELRDRLASVEGVGDVPLDPEALGTWIREDVFWLRQLPRDALRDLHDQASADLRAISGNIARCREKIAELERPLSRTDRDTVDRRFYTHYLEINEAAREEIVDVLAHRTREEALHKAYRLMHNVFDWHVPWAFRRHPSSYSPNEFHELRSKFLDLPVRKEREFERLYDEDLKAFDRELIEYLREHRPADQVRAAVREHHRLYERRDVLMPALEAFERGEFALFIAAVASQVEGIFEDACLERGVKSDSLLSASLSEKVRHLTQEEEFLGHEVYYAYRFPILRNRIAHGRTIEASLLVRTARLLLLDLRSVCNILRGDDTPLTRLVLLLRGVTETGPTVAQALKYASIVAAQPGLQLPGFYGLEAQEAETRRALEATNVWAALDALADRPEPVVAAAVQRIVIALKKERPATKDAAVSVLAKLGARDTDADEAGEQRAADPAVIPFEHWATFDAVPDASARANTNAVIPIVDVPSSADTTST